MDEIILDLEVLKKELRRVLVVGQDAAHFGRRVNDVFGLRQRVECPDGDPVQQVQFGTRAADQAGEAAPEQFAPDRAAHQAAVTSHINPSISRNVHSLRHKGMHARKQALTAASRYG